MSDPRQSETGPSEHRGGGWRAVGTAIGLALLILLAFSAGYETARLAPRVGAAINDPGDVAASATATPGVSSIDVFMEAWGIVQEKFVDRQSLQQRDLAYGAIGGLVAALNDAGHSRFLKPEDLKRETTDLAGKFEGIGATVGEQDGHLIIIAPIDGSPAQKAGILAGDIIVAVDGESVDGLTLTAVVDKIRGPAGTTVRVTVLHPGQTAPIEIPVVRAEIPVLSVTWTMIPGTKTADVRLSQFASNTSDQLIEVLKATKAAGATGIVLDLRNNYGGYLHEAVTVSSQFLSTGNVLVERDASDNRKPYAVEAGGVATEIPLVVLINGGTASAAEIVAGALQDHQRARLVGEKTFGAGTVLSTFGLKDGSALLIGTSEWLTPNGRRIWKTGIAPDVSSSLATGKRMLLPEDVAKLTADQLRASDDVQLLQALDKLGTTPAGTSR